MDGDQEGEKNINILLNVCLSNSA